MFSYRCIHTEIITEPMGIPYLLTNVDGELNNQILQSKCELIKTIGKENVSDVHDLNANVTQSFPCTRWEYDRTYFEMTFAMEVWKINYHINDLRSDIHVHVLND